MSIKVTINGQDLELPGPVALTAYIEDKGLTGRRIAVAHNGDVVSKNDYGTVEIADGDTLEIVRPVGGG